MKIDPHIHRPILVELIRSLCHVGWICAAEVGVASGATSEMLLREIPNLKLVMIDPWKKHFDGTKGSRRRTKADVEGVYRYAVWRTRFAEERRLVCRTASLTAAGFWSDQSFQLVFLDGLHFYVDVIEDLVAWWPKVARNGILAGHDYLSKRNDTGVWGVRKAVDEFVELNGLTLRHNETVWVIQKFTD